MTLRNPTHPGESIQMFCIDDGGLTVAEAAAHLRVEERDLLAVCRGQAPITADLAIRLDMAFGGNPRVWLELQLDYDLAQARKRAGALRIERIPEPDLEPAATDQEQWRRITHVITRIRHRGLRLYRETGNSRLLPQAYVRRITRILLLLDQASGPRQMAISGFRLHPLKGDLEGFWSVTVSGNLRIIFRFEGRDVVDVDLVDYH